MATSEDRRDRLSEVAQAIRSASPRLKEAQSDDDTLVFHYTSAEGLHGILDSHTIWMTADNETRDPLELRYANRRVEVVWRNRFGSLRPSIKNPRPRGKGIGLTGINPFHKGTAPAAPHGVYIASFCTQPDWPQLWQNFGAGGRGYSLGLRIRNNAAGWTARRDRRSNLFFGKVIYDESMQEDIVDELLQGVEAALRHHRAHDVRTAARQVFGETLPLFKHESYRDEDEWRLVATRIEDHTPTYAHIHAKEGALRAILEANTGQTLPITRIVVGPRAPRSSRAHAKALLAKTKRQDIPVDPSDW